ncbi:MAG: OsmC family protein, partial [Promethearchaeota archaeon]
MKVIINYEKDLHFTAEIRHFKNIHIDEPKSFHGTDLGPSSVEYMLIGIGGCLGSSFLYCLQKQNIELKNL